MVNAFLPEIPYPQEASAVKDALSYVCSLHSFHGYDTIYIGDPKHWGYSGPLESAVGFKRIKDDIAEKIQELHFIKEIPSSLAGFARRRRKFLLSKILDHMGEKSWFRSLDQEVDIAIDLRIHQFLQLYYDWVIACELRGLLVLPFARSLTIPFGMYHSSGAEIDEEVSMVFDSWFFTHFSDFDLTLPIVTEGDNLDDPPFAQELRKTRSLLSKTRVMYEAKELRDKVLLSFSKYAHRTTKFVRSSYKELSVVITGCSVSMLTKDLLPLISVAIELPSLTKHFLEDIAHKEFDSHLVLEPPHFQPILYKIPFKPKGIFPSKVVFESMKPNEGNSYLVPSPHDFGLMEIRFLQKKFFGTEKEKNGK